MSSKRDKNLQEILQQNTSLHYDSDRNKVICRLSGHEMPCTLTAIHSYVTGSKYMRLVKNSVFNYEAFRAHIVPSFKKGHEKQLFCKLTLRHITNIGSCIERHVNGKRFQKELARWQKCQSLGEIFKPYGQNRKRTRQSEDDVMSMNGGIREHEFDDLNDLYPAADFGGTTEAMETDDLPEVDDTKEITDMTDKRADVMATGDADSVSVVKAAKKRKTKKSRPEGYKVKKKKVKPM